MTTTFRKDFDKYREMDEDELLGNLSEADLKQLENVLEELDPEVRADKICLLDCESSCIPGFVLFYMGS